MADIFGKLVIERVEDVVAVNPVTDELLFILDEPTQGSLESAMETVWAEGKGGRRLYGIDRNKTARFTATNGYLVVSALQAQVGGSVNWLDSNNTAEVPVIEYCKPDSAGKFTLAYTPVAGSLTYVYQALGDMTQSETKYDASQLTINGTTVTLPAAADKTATYIVIYDRTATAGAVITNESDTYTSTAKVIFTILCHDVCDQRHFYNVAG